MTHNELVDRIAVEDALVRLFVATDRRDWEAVESCFADSVLFDMTSPGGDEPVRMAPRQITAVWEQGLARIEAVHHQVGNFQVAVTGDAATASCHGVAWHYRRVASGHNTRTFVGTYDFRLSRGGPGRWLIEAIHFHAKFVEGNLELHSELAAARG